MRYGHVGVITVDFTCLYCTTLQSSLANWVLRSNQYHCELGNQIANFETYLSTLVLLNFITSYLFEKTGNCNIMNPNPFTKQCKGYRVRPVKWFTVDKWLEGSKPFQVVHQFNLSRKTVTNIVDEFVHTERPTSTVCILRKYKNSSSKIGLLTRKGCWLQSPFWTFKESTSDPLSSSPNFLYSTNQTLLDFFLKGREKRIKRKQWSPG